MKEHIRLDISLYKKEVERLKSSLQIADTASQEIQIKIKIMVAEGKIEALTELLNYE